MKKTKKKWVAPDDILFEENGHDHFGEGRLYRTYDVENPKYIKRKTPDYIFYRFVIVHEDCYIAPECSVFTNFQDAQEKVKEYIKEAKEEDLSSYSDMEDFNEEDLRIKTYKIYKVKTPWAGPIDICPEFYEIED